MPRYVDIEPLENHFQERFNYLFNKSQTKIGSDKWLINEEIQAGAVIAKEFLDKTKNLPTAKVQPLEWDNSGKFDSVANATTDSKIKKSDICIYRFSENSSSVCMVEVIEVVDDDRSKVKCLQTLFVDNELSEYMLKEGEITTASNKYLYKTFCSSLINYQQAEIKRLTTKLDKTATELENLTIFFDTNLTEETADLRAENNKKDELLRAAEKENRALKDASFWQMLKWWLKRVTSQHPHQKGVRQ